MPNVQTFFCNLNGMSTSVGVASDGIAAIYDDNTISFNRTGVVNLTFTSIIDGSVNQNIYLLVVDAFDDMVISSDVNFATSYKNGSMFTMQYLPINVFTALVKNGELIAAGSNYSTLFEVYLDGELVSIIAERDNKEIAEYYTISNNAFTFNTLGTYTIKVKVHFTADDKTFCVTSDDWTFDVEVANKATDISISASDYLVLEGDEYVDVDVTVYTNSVANLPIKVDVTNVETDDVTRYIIDNYTEIKTQSLVDGVFVDVPMNNLELNVSVVSVDNNVYKLRFSVGSSFRHISSIKEYTLAFSDYVVDEEGLDPEEVTLYVTMQEIKSINLVHYAYTQKVSQIVNVLNTDIDVQSGTAPSNGYAYSFTQNPESKIIAGSEGLIVIDLYPYYADIEEVSLVAQSKNSDVKLALAQMVVIKGDDGEDYYIHSDVVKSANNGGIKLNLVSSVSGATLKVSDKSFTLDGTPYYNEFTASSNSSSIGRLFVKTMAPSSLTSKDAFDITVTVKYKTASIDGDSISYQTQSQQSKYTLLVEDMEGFDLEISHEGVERNVIAYTGTVADDATDPDWLDLYPTISSGYELGSIVCKQKRKSGGKQDEGDRSQLKGTDRTC